MVSNVISTCPNTKVVMSGYSQGGQLIHNAAKLLPAATMAKVNSVVIFGDPSNYIFQFEFEKKRRLTEMNVDNGEAVQGATAQNTLVICHTGDDICLHGDLILVPHLTYSENVQQAATFVAAQAGLAMGNT
jgi:cutinase